jgi:hypothetical protein
VEGVGSEPTVRLPHSIAIGLAPRGALAPAPLSHPTPLHGVLFRVDFSTTLRGGQPSHWAQGRLVTSPGDPGRTARHPTDAPRHVPVAGKEPFARLTVAVQAAKWLATSVGRASPATARPRWLQPTWPCGSARRPAPSQAGRLVRRPVQRRRRAGPCRGRRTVPIDFAVLSARPHATAAVIPLGGMRSGAE